MAGGGATDGGTVAGAEAVVGVVGIGTGSVGAGAPAAGTGRPPGSGNGCGVYTMPELAHAVSDAVRPAIPRSFRIDRQYRRSCRIV